MFVLRSSADDKAALGVVNAVTNEDGSVLLEIAAGQHHLQLTTF